MYKYQIISQESKTIFDDETQGFLKIYKITFIRENSNIVEFYEKEFPENSHKDYMKIVTLQEIKNLHSCNSLKDVLRFIKKCEPKFCVCEMTNKELHAFTYMFDKQDAYRVIEQITGKKIKYFNEVSEYQIKFYAEGLQIIKLVNC